MTLDFEELDYRPTPLGELSLRRRMDPMLGDSPVYEVKLGDEFLMSSVFTASEIALGELSLTVLDTHLGCSNARPDVVVGGLGLGYTALAALRHEGVGRVIVVDALPEVIEWHRNSLVPLGAALCSDQRLRFVCGDFFSLVRTSFDPQLPAARFDAILLDVDHSPSQHLNARNASFYTVEGLRTVVARLRDHGVFALWSNDPPDKDFIAILETGFGSVESRIVAFENPYQNCESSCTVYIASEPRA